jgi:hypothetical protein
LQTPQYSRAYHASVTGYVYLRIFFHIIYFLALLLPVASASAEFV